VKPRLYPENETNFESNGLGPLSDALACTVEENRNGAFELSMEYPVTGVLFDELKHGSIIFAPPNDSSEPQPFRVYGKSTPLSGVVTVRAKHISYQLSHIPVSPFTAGSCAAALQGLKTNAVEPCPFDFWTDKETVATFTVTEPASARSLLGGVAGSVLDVYGGEYEFDRYTVKLHKARGTDSGVVIAYGKNLVDIDQEESIENTITGVYPYYKDTDGNVLELPEKVVSGASAHNFPYPRTVPLDCSQEWQETPSVEQLRAYASAYVEKEGIGVPSVSLKVSFVPLWQTEEYKAIAPAERLNLCDIATVRFEKLGVNARAKVVQTVYDVLAGRYESITLGEASTNLADTIVAQDKAINAKADTSDLEAAAANASAWITGNKGGYVVLRRNADGQPYELLIMDKPTIEEATKVWRFNKSGLGYSSTGYNGTYGLAMTQDGQIVADYITTGTLSANLLRAGVLQDKTGKVFKLDLDAGTLDANFTSLQVSGKTPEQIAAEQAKEAAAADLKEYQAAVEKTVQDLQGQIDGNITTWFYPYAPTAENKPASDWTTETEREAHAGDLFYNTDQASGKAYRWAIVGDVWQWLLLEDTDVAKALANAKTAQDTADGKRRTFISTPVPPYDVGDLWAQGKDGALLACIKKKTGSQLYSADDWTDAANYTKAAEAMLKDYADTVNEQLEGLGQQIDGKTETWFYPYDPTAENEPASGWKTEEDRKAHEGDLFYNTDPASGKAYRWAKDGNAWAWALLQDADVSAALAAAKQAKDTADGKRRTFISTPVPPYDVGDIWTQGDAGELLVCTTAKASGAAFAASDWASAADYTAQAAEAGRNLISNSAYIGVTSTYTGFDFTGNQVKITLTDGNSARSATRQLTEYGIQSLRNRKITVSYDYKITEAITYAESYSGTPGGLGRLEITFADGTKQYIGAPRNDFKALGTAAMDDFARVTATATVQDKEVTAAIFKVFFQGATGAIIYKNPKVEPGGIATAWTPAPEDTTLAATAPALTQQEVFNRLTNNGQLQGLYMSDGKLYINAQYIAAGRIASVDGKSYFDLNTGNAVLRGSFSTLERTNSTGTYRVFFDSGNIACQKKNGDNWDNVGFLSWNYGISPPETWIKASRVDVLNSLDTPGVWLSGTGWGKTLYAEGGLRRLDVDNINGYKVQWYWDSAISKWVLGANA
jgi:phage minor structural protein